MAVPTVLTDFSTTAASNSPSGSETVGSSLDDYLRGIQAVTRLLAHKGADIASATTMDIGAVPGLFHDITGTTTVTGLGTVSAGIWKVLKYENAVPLIHNATSLILLGAANRTTANGDVQFVASEGSGNWREFGYFTAANGGFIVGATQAQMEAASSSSVPVVPSVQHHHPGHPKCWAVVTVAGGTPTLQTSYNITSITDTAAGRLTITIATDFSTANWAAVATTEVLNVYSGTAVSASLFGVCVDSGGKAAGSVLLESYVHSTDGASANTVMDLADPVSWSFAGFGDQA